MAQRRQRSVSGPSPRTPACGLRESGCCEGQGSRDNSGACVNYHDWTTIVVAHKLSTILAAGLILVLDSGKVIESGSHSELVTRRGFYAHLVERQMTSVQSRDASVAV